MNQVPLPLFIHNIHGPNISVNEVVNIAPGEGQMPLSFISKLDYTNVSFVKNYSNGEKHFNTRGKVRIMLSKYLHFRLKYCDDRFASGLQYIFQTLDWI